MKSTRSTVYVKRPAKGSKEYPKAAEKAGIFPHLGGSWCKTLGRRNIYCGSWKKGVTWEQALRLYYIQVEAIKDGRDPKAAMKAFLLGRDPRTAGTEAETPLNSRADTFTLGQLLDDVLASQRRRVAAGDISPRTLDDLIELTNLMPDHLGGRSRRVVTIGPADFAKLRAYFAVHWCPERINKCVGIVKQIFRFGRDTVTKREPEFGPEFRRVPAKAKKKAKREKRLERGKVLLEAREIQTTLMLATPPLKAMILLGINLGFENETCGMLTFHDLAELRSGFHHIPRFKNFEERKGKVWPETIKALDDYMAVRPKPENPEHARIVFITKYGKTWTAIDKKALADKETAGHDAKVSKEFSKLLETAGVKRPGVSFYALRHTLATRGKPISRGYAMEAVLGHVPPSMTANYVEEVPDKDVAEITDEMHNWLFDPAVVEEAAKVVEKIKAQHEAKVVASRVQRDKRAAKTMLATMARKHAERKLQTASASAEDA